MEVAARRRRRKVASTDRCGTNGQPPQLSGTSCRHHAAGTPPRPSQRWSGRRKYHGWKWEDWEGVPRKIGDSVSYLPLSALLSQTVVAFAMNYEERSPVPLSLATAVIKRIPPDGRPVPGLGHSVGISALRRHGFVRVTGVAGGEVILLTPKGAAVSDAHEERLRAVETDWCSWLGSAQVDALRQALENVLGAASYAARDQ
jgi:hypothetical protein